MAQDNLLTKSNNQDDQKYYIYKTISSIYFDHIIEKLPDSNWHNKTTKCGRNKLM